MQKICILGLGYIGLPTASIFAKYGFNVLGIDVNQEAVNIINSGKIHIVEPELDIIVKDVVKLGRLKAATVIEPADVFIIAVPTPFKDDYKADLSFVFSATDSISEVLKKGNLVILESTSPPLTTKRIAERLEKKTGLVAGEDFYVSHCPERVLPGQIIRELVENDRIIGGINKKSTELTIDLYKNIVKGKLLSTNAETAEMVKLCENTYRDINIAYANELSIISDKLNIDVWELIELANHHPRVNIHSPGPGVGGHCLAVDPWFIVEQFPVEAKLIRTAREVNNYKPEYIFNKIIMEAEKMDNPVIGCLGISYKPDIDDLRESPSLEIVKALVKKTEYSVLISEPNILDNISKENSRLTEGFNIRSLQDVLNKSNIIVLLVDHKEYKNIQKEDLKNKIIIDTRGLWRK